MTHNVAVKRILSLAIAVIMLFSVVSVGIMQTTAEGEVCSIEIDITGSGYFNYSYTTPTTTENRKSSKKKTINVPVGTEITLTAIERYTDENPSSSGLVAPFVCWQTDKKRIITMNEVYTFTAVSSRKVEVLFGTHPIGTYTARYVNNAGVILNVFGNVPTGTSPADFYPKDFVQTYARPVLPGYEFLGWDQLPDDYKNSTSFVIVKPRYYLLPVSYTLDITNESGVSGAKTYSAFSKAAAFANQTNSEGQSFLYWKDAKTNEIVSYSPLFLFYITRNTTLTAVYGNSPVTSGVCVRISNSVKDVDKSLMTFYAERSVTSDLEVVETGILLSATYLDENSFVLSAAGVSKGISTSKANSGLYSLAKKGVLVNDTYYARAYVAYKDAAGAINVAYSDIYSQTM